MAVWDDDPIKTGELWRQKEFPCFTVVTVFLGDWRWALMTPTLPHECKHGWFAMGVSSEQNGKWLYTREEALERLTKNNYTRMGVGVDSYFKPQGMAK